MQCISPLSIRNPLGNTNAVRITVPCGKCGACLHNRRIDWSFRLKQEQKASISGWFVTFTYDPAHLPIKNGVQTLQKRPVQLLLKRIRKHHQGQNKKLTTALKMPPVRFYAIGEYGAKTDRPHYHALLFNMHLKTASTLDKFWPKGQINMAAVTDASIHYMTKYHVNTKQKKFVYDENTGEELTLDELRQPEFALMSRRPGIGHQYIKKIGKWHMENMANYVINSEFKQRIPRYYKSKVLTRKAQELQNKDMIEQSDQRYQRELKRLSQLKISNPLLYIENSNYHKSLLILKESKNGLNL